MPPFDFLRFYINPEARFEGDIELPFTHAIYLARRDFFYPMTLTLFTAGATGFREESDVQAKIYTRGGKIIMTNDTHSVHMHPSEVTSGGQRVGRFANLFWSMYYTSYFFKKYYNPIMKRQGKSGCYLQGIMIYSVLRIYLSFIRLFFIFKEKLLG